MSESHFKQAQPVRYHGTGACDFTVGAVTRTIDKLLEELASRAGHDVYLVNVATTPHPAGSIILVTVIAENVKES